MNKYQLLRPLTAEERTRLRDSIRRDGVKVPIEYDEEGNILDGHHRVDLCRELGITKWPRIVRVGMSETEKLLHVLALNDARRQLDEADIDRVRQERIRLEIGLRQQGESLRAISRKTGVSHEQVRQDLSGVNRLTPETVTGADGKQYPATQAPREPQPVGLFNPTDKDIERAQAWRELTESASPVPSVLDAADLRKRYRKEAEAKAKAAAQAAPLSLPEGKYRALVIDPPWDVHKILRDERPNQDALDYPTMTDDEIAALPVRELADDEGCHVYLWTTHSKLPAALAILEDWGARYQCMMTWVKNVGFTPFSWMYSTEHVLFGRIGSLPLLRNGLRLDFSAPVTKHSEKPDVFYERVLEASPGPRLEMFARRTRAEFTVWGNEV